MSNPFLADRIANGALRPLFPKMPCAPARRRSERAERRDPGEPQRVARARRIERMWPVQDVLQPWKRWGLPGAFARIMLVLAAETSQQTAVMIDATC